MTVRTISAVLTAMLFLATTAFAADDGPVSFSVHGKPVLQLSLAEMQKKVPATQLTVWDPHEDKNVAYEGIDVGKLFAAIYGDDWKKIDEVLFTCVDGYQPVIPIDRFKRHASLLAYKRLDQPVFNVQNRFQNQKDVPLGPFYLVWDDLQSKELRDQGANAWAYQIVGVDLVTFADRFPRLSPPQDASAKAKKGFLAFRENCMSCHTINGEGGNKAPELNYPMSVTEYLSDAWMHKWLMDPRSVRYNSTMPGFASQPDPAAFIDDVLAYLKTMARNKQKPE